MEPHISKSNVVNERALTNMKVTVCGTRSLPIAVIMAEAGVVITNSGSDEVATRMRTQSTSPNHTPSLVITPRSASHSFRWPNTMSGVLPPR